MPATRHPKIHFTSGELVRDIVTGMTDGRPVPFAPAAESIAKGLGGYLAARSDAGHYGSERVFSESTGRGTSAAFPEYHNRQRRQRDVDAVRTTVRCHRLGRYHAAVPHVAAAEQLRIRIQNLVV